MLNSQPQQQQTPQVETKQQQRRPNEQGSFDIQAHVKIFDPQTKEVYLEGRA